MYNVCKTHIGEDLISELPEEPFFVDFMRDAPEPTGEEGEDADLEAPKIYEHVCENFYNRHYKADILFFLTIKIYCVSF